MGTLRKKERTDWTEERMQQRLARFLSTPRYILYNLYVFGWESDLLFLSKSGIWTEIEIKVSRADFHADLKNKGEKHRLLADKHQTIKPNRFFYAVPEGLVQPEEVPDHAGLLTVNDGYFVVNIKRPAPWLHRHKISPEELNLADKFYYNMVNARRQAVEAMAKARELTDAYAQGYTQGRDDAVGTAIRLWAERCPHRIHAAEGRLTCTKYDKTGYHICDHLLCDDLATFEENVRAATESPL